MSVRSPVTNIPYFALAVLLLVGCAESPPIPTSMPETTALTEPTEEPTELSPGSADLTPTELPPQPGNENKTLTAQDVLAGTEQTEWDLIILGDSDMTVSQMYYSKYFEEDLGIKIVRQYEPQDSPFSPFIQLQEDQELRAEIAEAEIIVFNIPFVRPIVGGDCFDYNKKMEVDGCFDISIDEYKETTQNMIWEIKSLVGEKGAMIRLQNMLVPLRFWQDNLKLADRTQDCLECFVAYWDAQAEVAAQEGIPVIDVFTLFHGEDHDQDPYEKGYMASDLIHVNLVGAETIAKLYREVGYEYWKP